MSLKPGDIDLSDPDAFAEGPPVDYLAVLRREAPVHWNPSPAEQKTVSAIGRGFWVLSKYADVVHVSRNPKLFSSHVGSCFLWDADEEQLPGLQTQLINMDPPSHVKYRRLVQRGFTPRMVSKLEPVIRTHAREIVDRVAARGSCELVDDLACELPLILICELMGIPIEDRRRIFEWSNQMIGADDPDMATGTNPQDAAAQVWLYCNALAAQKMEAPDDTLISKYLHAEVEGEKINEVELNNFFLLLSVAGNETTRNATAHFMRLMFEHPDQYALLKSDVDRYLPGAIEEVLRFSPPVVHFRRTALEDAEIRGVPIAKGDKLYLSYPSANRDEEVFDRADEFDIARKKNEHISFGIGEHFCLGANLARMQLRCILREVVTRLPDMKPAAPLRRQRSNFIDGIKQLPVVFTPAS